MIGRGFLFSQGFGNSIFKQGGPFSKHIPTAFSVPSAPLYGADSRSRQMNSHIWDRGYAMDAVMISHTSSAQQASQLQHRTQNREPGFFGQFVTDSTNRILSLSSTSTPIANIWEFMGDKFLGSSGAGYGAGSGRYRISGISSTVGPRGGGDESCIETNRDSPEFNVFKFRFSSSDL